MSKIETKEKELNPFIKQALDKSLEQSFAENLKSNDEVINSIKVWLDSKKNSLKK
jgi:hypothetical protein